MLSKKSGEVIDAHRSLDDIGIETSCPFTSGDHVPQGNTCQPQSFQALRVGHSRPGIKQFAHDAPEGILLVGVIFLRIERGFARQAAKDKHPRRRIGHRRKAVTQRH